MSTVQNFIQKKKKKTKTKTNVYVLCKLEEILSRQKKKKKNKTKKQRKDKSRKRQKVGHGREKGNFVQHILPHFLPILERLNCGGPKEKMAGPHHFSLPLSLSSKHPSHQFSLLFSTLFFPSSLKSTHPNMVLASHTTQVTKCNTM